MSTLTRNPWGSLAIPAALLATTTVALTSGESMAQPPAKTAPPAVAKVQKPCEVGNLADCTKRCDAGVAGACTNAGALLHRGSEGGVPDDAAAARLYQKGCNLGSDAGCANLARLHEKGQGVARSDARALALYTKACEHRYASACTGLGSIYRDGRGVPRDRERAAQLFERACDGNDATGCRDLGVCAATGDGMAQDVTRAATLFQAACDHGDLVGCARLGDALLRGAGVPADRPKGIALLHKACDAGVKLGCARLPVERAHVDAPVVEPVVTKEPRSLPLVYTGAVIGSAGLITAIGALFVMAADHTCEIATSCSLAQNDAEISKSRAEIIALGAGGGALLVGGIMTWVGATKVPVTKPSEPPTASLQPVVTPRFLGLTGTF